MEGVESTAQLVLLAEWGCDLYQGFLGAGALDELELARFVAVSHGERRLGGTGSFARSAAAATRAKPVDNLQGSVEPGFRRRPVAR